MCGYAPTYWRAARAHVRGRWPRRTWDPWMTLFVAESRGRSNWTGTGQVLELYNCADRSLHWASDRGHLMGWLQNKFEKNFMISTVDYVFNWARKSAVWPMTFGLACCAIEMIAS